MNLVAKDDPAVVNCNMLSKFLLCFTIHLHYVDIVKEIRKALPADGQSIFLIKLLWEAISGSTSEAPKRETRSS